MANPKRQFTLIALVSLLSAGVAAHDIPSDVTVRAFLKPSGQTLELMVRVPVAASQNDVEWPTRGVLLDLAQVEPTLRGAGAAWVAGRIDVDEEDQRLGSPRVAAARISLPSDTSFDGYEHARALLDAPSLPADTEVALGQALLDVRLEYPIQSDRARFSIATRFGTAGLRSTTVLRFETPAGVERAFQFHDDPGMVRLDPRWLQAASRFTVDGFFHILGGIDHLLFLVCLIIPFRKLRPLVPIVTSFTVAHSVTLIASAYDMAPGAAWFPPLVETLIATSIVYMALENIVAPQLRRRWMITFAFGLVHGFGFSFALRDTLQFAGEHLLTSLVAFNVGVEIGQLFVLALAIPALTLLFRVTPERIGTIILSALVAHTGWHWMIDRGAQLGRYPFEWPVFDAIFFALLLRWLMLAVALGGLAWLIFGVLAKQRGSLQNPEPVERRL